jgi:hypothetical protein
LLPVTCAEQAQAATSKKMKMLANLLIMSRFPIPPFAKSAKDGAPTIQRFSGDRPTHRPPKGWRPYIFRTTKVGRFTGHESTLLYHVFSVFIVSFCALLGHTLPHRTSIRRVGGPVNRANARSRPGILDCTVLLRRIVGGKRRAEGLFRGKPQHAIGKS